MVYEWPKRRSDDDPLATVDYDDTNSITNDNINLAGGYYNSYDEDPYNTNNYYDPYYGYNNDNNNYGYNYDNSNEGRLLTFGEPSFYFGNWINNAQGLIARTSDSIQRFESDYNNFPLCLTFLASVFGTFLLYFSDPTF